MELSAAQKDSRLLEPYTYRVSRDALQLINFSDESTLELHRISSEIRTIDVHRYLHDAFFQATFCRSLPDVRIIEGWIYVATLRFIIFV